MSTISYSLGRALRAQIRRDFLLVWARRGDALQPLMFALMVATLFPFALGGERETLAGLASGIIWVTILLSSLLGLDALYRGDHDDGSLEQMLLGPTPLHLIILIRIGVHWLTAIAPLILVTPLLAQMLHLPSEQLPTLMISLLLGSPLLSLLGAVVAALTVGIRRSGMILALLALPLFIPVLVLGAGSVVAAAQGLPVDGVFMLRAGALLLAIVLAPLAAAAAIRIALT